VLVVLPTVQALHPMASPAKGDMGKSGEGRKAQVEDGGTFADDRCSEAILEFLQATDVGSNVPVEKAETESTESGADALGASASTGCAGSFLCASNFPNLCFLFGRHRI